VEFLSNLNVKFPYKNVKPPTDDFRATVLGQTAQFLTTLEVGCWLKRDFLKLG